MTLIRPPAIWSVKAVNFTTLTPPLAIAYLSAALRGHGFSVTNIDAVGEGLDQLQKLKRNPNMEAQGLNAGQIIARIPPDTNLIGISTMFSLEWPATRDLITEIRKSFPETKILVGGEHVTALPEWVMNECPAIDFILCGEGEANLLLLTEKLQQQKPVQDIPGLVYRENGCPTRSSAMPKEATFDGISNSRVRNPDTLHWPAWDLTPLQNYLDRKLTFGRYVGVTMPILGSRGCPFECTFCSNPLFWGRRYVTRTPKDVVDEIAEYKKVYEIEAVEFYDLTPIVKKSWILEFCNELINRKINIRWQISGGTRCEAIDEEVIIQAKRAGCEYIGFAPESGSQEVLNRIKKRIKLSHMFELIRHAKKHGVDTRCNIIIGFPEDTRWQIYQSLWFQLKLAIMGVVDAPVFEFTPYPGSALFDQLRKDGSIPQLDDSFFENLGGLNLNMSERRAYCYSIGPWELFVYRNFGMAIFYGIYYLIRPRKLYNFFRNLWDFQKSNSVFEQRVIQNISKQLLKLNPKAKDQDSALPFG